MDEDVSGPLASLAIIAACVAGVVAISRMRQRELAAQGVRLWTPQRKAFVALALFGLLVIVVAQPALAWLDAVLAD